MKTISILLYRGTGIINSLIRWQTRSHYAHAAIHYNGSVYEALPFKGVIVRPVEDRDTKDAAEFIIAGGGAYLVEDQLGLALDFLSAQVGRKYDFGGIVRFMTRQKSPKNKRWFCSELVYAAIQAAGLNLLNENEAYKISPALLSLSPYLHRVNGSSHAGVES
jgi:uncharacterized protein YycO